MCRPDAVVSISNSAITNNDEGIATTASSSVARVSGCTITRNTLVLSAGLGSTLASFGTNRLAGNTVDGTFTGTIALQ
jgi:parallel beta-helix repeat protein